MAVTRPAVHLLSHSAAAILRAFDLPSAERAASIHSAEELKLIAAAARRLGLLPKFQETLVRRALELGDVPVREMMTPRPKIFSLPSNMLFEACSRIATRHHSRIPVYDEARGPEYIVGAVYARDLARFFYLRAEAAVRPELRLKQIMHEVLVVPETKSALDLLLDFQRLRRHLAIAVDEFGSTVGLVTAEDAIEQLVGEIEDEFDTPSTPFLLDAGGALTIDGNTNLRDLEMQMQWSLPRSGGVETVAGFVLAQLGHIPQSGESVVYEGRRLTVVSMEALRIAKIRVEKAPAPPQA
jgi:CBS domain containing-hemolysin-like protein